jgi:hypothetical protein
MRVIITQMRAGDDLFAGTEHTRPLFKHNGYAINDHCGEMFTSEPGYEISAVYIVPDMP